MKTTNLIHVFVAIVFSGYAQSIPSQSPPVESHWGYIPHGPNFLGKNACFGIEPMIIDEKNKPLQRIQPTITTSTLLGEQKATHEIAFGNKKIIVTEDVVDAKSCEGLPMNWGVISDSTGKGEFCTSSWTEDIYMKFNIQALDNDRRLLSTLYAVGPCQFDDVPPNKRVGYGYGAVLKVSSMPMRIGP
jgi:hypothetical protein